MDDDYDDNSLLSYPSSSAYKNQDDGYYGVDDSFVYGEDNTFGKYGSEKNSMLVKWARIPRKYKLAGLVGCMLTILLLIIASVLLVIFLSNFLDSGGNSGEATQHSTAVSSNPDKTSGPNDGTTYPQPKFPSTYKTDISFLHFVPEQNDEEYFEIVGGNMTLHTDDVTASLYMNASVVYWTGVHHNNQVIIDNLTGAYDLTNSRCTFFPDQMYNNMFFWVSFSEQLEGTQIVDEIDCVVWELYFSSNFYLQLFIDKESYTGPYQIPVQMVVAFDRTIQQFNFTDFEPITFNRTLLTPPETCMSEHICEDSPPYPFQFYRFRDIEDNKISNRTVSDLEGTTSLLCIVLLADGYRQDTLLSQYNLRVNTTWGQFSYCGRTGCVGGDPFTVGREATLAMKDDPWLGQCTDAADNDGVGSLYSLRADAACPQGQQVGYQGCAWEPSAPVKTVQFSCLMQGGTLLQACLADVNIPFASATQEFKRLFDECDNVALPPPDGPQPSPHPHPTAPPPPPSNSQKMVDLAQSRSALQLGPFGFQRVVQEELANYRTF